jgi:hypothetical protein
MPRHSHQNHLGHFEIEKPLDDSAVKNFYSSKTSSKLPLSRVKPAVKLYVSAVE